MSDLLLLLSPSSSSFHPPPPPFTLLLLLSPSSSSFHPPPSPSTLLPITGTTLPASVHREERPQHSYMRVLISQAPLSMTFKTVDQISLRSPRIDSTTEGAAGMPSTQLRSLQYTLHIT